MPTFMTWLVYMFMSVHRRRRSLVSIMGPTPFAVFALTHGDHTAVCEANFDAPYLVVCGSASRSAVGGVCNTPFLRCLYLEPMDSFSYYLPRLLARSSLSPPLHDVSVFVKWGGPFGVLLALYRRRIPSRRPVTMEDPVSICKYTVVWSFAV